MKKSVLLLNLCIWMIGITLPVIATGFTSFPPDRARNTLDLMAAECQSLNDYSFQASQGMTDNFETILRRFDTFIRNMDYYIGAYDPQISTGLREIQRAMAPDAASAQQAVNLCMALRDSTYKKIASVDGLLNPPLNIRTQQMCESAGYFSSDGTCFIGGYVAYDAAGQMIGIYNATCYIGENTYYGSCWYCGYGNDESGCLPHTP